MLRRNQAVQHAFVALHDLRQRAHGSSFDGENDWSGVLGLWVAEYAVAVLDTRTRSPNQIGGSMEETLEFRVGQKGGVSVYGLGRFPVTLYHDQWIKLLAAKEELLQFIEAHEPELKKKS
jgi:hypothetical protein